ncbi:MAG: alanine--tRNA ligase [Bdellovibrionaceae bacterium]|nr:alanine--tRNA ligase [Pseudobdellovibrionaceae bacterium]
MTHSELRKAFISHFTALNHKQVVSSSLIPHNDPTLLFTNAGMNQFKNAFLGSETLDYQRAVTIQKCVRAGGKHNDLENVGYTTRHHTFFEMMGNFSFGDYFKKEAIHYAWDLLTNKLSIPKDKLYVTVFETDDEAADIWHKQEGVPKDRIFRMGEKDNFWRMGETGPCGPCSEIYYDHGPAASKKKNSRFGEDDDRYVEIWNLVFMQYFEDANGLTPLPKPSVDTGAGLERVAAVLQGKVDNYQTDLFEPIIRKACEFAKSDFSQWYTSPLNAAFKVVSDHARAACFLMADGILPSNEGRGYVLRRILRRAIRYAQKISTNENTFRDICAVVIHEMSSFYPELESNKNQILTSVAQETQKFLSTLSQGTSILENYLHDLKKQNKTQVDGKMAFKLYDTFGFPIDLTQLIAREQNVQVNLNDFEKEMTNARQKAKQARKSHMVSANDQHLMQWSQNIFKTKGATHFIGYSSLSSVQVKPLSLSTGDKEVNELAEGAVGFAIFNESPFYAEGGGQVGDHGEITDGQTVIEVFDCSKMNDIHIHHVQVKSGHLKLDNTYNVNVSSWQRHATAKNHSATHLLHAALKHVLGDHVGQAGSLVSDQKLRFDFSHPKALNSEELASIELLVNEQVAKALPITADVLPYKEALKKGAVAMFGEKYGDEVRVLSMGSFSKELCGGTHIQNTAEIGTFKIVSESSVSAGVRRIEGITGLTAYQYFNKNTQENTMARRFLSLPTQWESYLQENTTDVMSVLESQQKDMQELRKQLQAAKSSSVDVDGLLSQAQTITTANGELKVLVQEIAIDDRKVLSELVDKLRDRSQNLIVLLVGSGTNDKPFLAACNKNLKHVHCGHVAKALTEKFGGKGGGRPDYAQGSLEKFNVEESMPLIKSLLV